MIKIWKPEACLAECVKKRCKYWFHLIKYTLFLEPKQKDQTFILVDRTMSIIIHNQENESRFMSRYTLCRIN